MQVVNRYIDQGVAELVPGVLFIDEVRRRVLHGEAAQGGMDRRHRDCMGLVKNGCGRDGVQNWCQSRAGEPSDWAGRAAWGRHDVT